jgi:hypothetical protein
MEVIKEDISRILGIENNHNWNIIDCIPSADLYLVHYNENSNMCIYGHLRGVIVDIHERRIVCKSHGNTISLTSDIINEDDDNLIINDVLVNKKDAKIMIGFEGTLLRIFKHRGVVYYSTHRKINCVNSKWGNSMTFYKMYETLNGPTPEQLFDNDDDTSIKLFLIVHPDVQNVSKLNLGDGFLIYLGTKSLDGSIINEEKEIFDSFTNHIVDVNDANEHLVKGFQGIVNKNDYRLSSGEFIVIYEMENDNLKNVIKVESHSYSWRSVIRDNNPNILHQFYKLLDHAYTRDFRLFPRINYIPIDEIKLPVIEWPQDSSNIEARPVYRVWASLLMTIPLCKQEEAMSFIETFNRQNRELNDGIFELSNDDNYELQKDINDTIKYIIKNAKVLSSRRIEYQQKNYSKEIESFDSLMKYNIKKLINEKNGACIYKMIKCMNNYKKKEE